MPRPSWAHVIAFTALAGVTCSAGTVLGAGTAVAAVTGVRVVAAAATSPKAPPTATPAVAPAPTAGSGWGVQTMGGSPNPVGRSGPSVQPTVYVPPVPGDAVQAAGGGTGRAGGEAPAAPVVGGPVGAPVGLPAGVPVSGPTAAATPSTSTTAAPPAPAPAVPPLPSRAPARPSAPTTRATAALVPPTAVRPVPVPVTTPPVPVPQATSPRPTSPPVPAPAVPWTPTPTSAAPAPPSPAIPTSAPVPPPTVGVPPVPVPAAPAQPNPPVGVQVVVPPGVSVIGTPSVQAPAPGQAAGPVSVTLNLNLTPGTWSVATQAAPPPTVAIPPTVAAPAPSTVTVAPAPMGAPAAPVPTAAADQPALPDRPPPPTSRPGQPAVSTPTITVTQPATPTRTPAWPPAVNPAVSPPAPAPVLPPASGQGAGPLPTATLLPAPSTPPTSSSDGRPTPSGRHEHSQPGRPAPTPGPGEPPQSPNPGPGEQQQQQQPSAASRSPQQQPAGGTAEQAAGGAGSRGWASGASGPGVADGSFAGWRGSPVTVAATWNDGDAASQTDLPTLKGEFKDWSGDLDVAVGGTELGSGESYAQAAQGAYVQRWTTMAQNLQTARGDKPGTTFVRPFHEFNGNWYENWFVTPDRLEDYKKSFRLMAQTVRANCPRCKIVWSPGNGGSTGAARIADAWPGDDVVDVVGVDTYNANGNTRVTDPQSWQEYLGATNDGQPVGPEAWRQFAASHGKPISFPEWGLNSGGGGGDDPQFIQGMHDWMAQNAATAGDPNLAGKVLYDVYFNIAMGDNTGFVIKDGPNPQAGKLYTSLRWGNSDGAAVPTLSSQGQQGQQPQPQAWTPTQVQNLQVGPMGRPQGAEPATLKDVAYADRSPAEHLDLYLPRGTGAATPLVIQIHGGGFSDGNKSDGDLAADVQPLLDAGYAVASINYRLSGEAPFPAGLQDAKAAVRWLRAHAAEHGLDPNRFAAWGSSAGGYLATMLGVTGSQANEVLDDAQLGNGGVHSTVQAVVSLYGPADFATMDTQLAGSGCDPSVRTHDAASSPESIWLGAPVQSSPLKDASNPIAWLPSVPAGSLPPFFLGHGGSDCTVPVGQSAELSDALKRSGATVQLQVVDGAGHSDPAIDQGLRQPAIDFLTQRLVATAASTAALPQPAPAAQPAPTPGQQPQQPQRPTVPQRVEQQTPQPAPLGAEPQQVAAGQPSTTPPPVSSSGS